MSRGRRLPRLWLALCLLVVGNAGVALLIWQGATVGQRHQLAPGLLAVTTVVAVAAVLVRRLTPSATLAVSLATAVIAGLLLVPFAHIAVLRQWAHDEPKAEAVVARLLTSSDASQCLENPPDMPVLRTLGRIDQACVLSGPFQTVTLMRLVPDRGYEGVIYSPEGDPQYSDSCFRHLDGPWWELSTAAVDCPSGFDFQGGG